MTHAPHAPPMQAYPYEGRADHAWPPFSEGWAEVPFHHDTAVVARAKGLLGALPVYYYADEALPTGLYRFFAFETPVGHAVSALKYVGAAQARTLGASPVLLGAADQSTINAAAKAVNTALIAHGYIQSDQGLYKAFQTSYGAPDDGFPGTDFFYQLQTTLSAIGVPMASVAMYPWLATTSSGATGQAAYDGTNAPLWSDWTGAGTGPAPPAAAAAASSSSGGTAAAVAGLVALTVGGIALYAKSAGGLSFL